MKNVISVVLSGLLGILLLMGLSFQVYAADSNFLSCDGYEPGKTIVITAYHSSKFGFVRKTAEQPTAPEGYSPVNITVSVKNVDPNMEIADSLSFFSCPDSDSNDYGGNIFKVEYETTHESKIPKGYYPIDITLRVPRSHTEVLELGSQVNAEDINTPKTTETHSIVDSESNDCGEYVFRGDDVVTTSKSNESSPTITVDVLGSESQVNPEDITSDNSLDIKCESNDCGEYILRGGGVVTTSESNENSTTNITVNVSGFYSEVLESGSQVNPEGIDSNNSLAVQNENVPTLETIETPSIVDKGNEHSHLLLTVLLAMVIGLLIGFVIFFLIEWYRSRQIANSKNPRP